MFIRAATRRENGQASPGTTSGEAELRSAWTGEDARPHPPAGLPYNTSDDCASSRNAAGETSEPGDRGNARGRL